jgi:hypothetical protein
MAACSQQTPDPTGNRCIPGQSAACTCTDGSKGAQLCKDDGTYASCTCSGGSGPDGAAEDQSSSGGPKRVFVTRLTYLATAISDSLCQNVASGAGLGGTWKAWLSYNYSAATPAINQVKSNGPWKLLTGEVVFQNHGQLATTPNVPIQVNEQGALLPANEYVWTGTTTGGVTSGNDCLVWDTTSSSWSATVGSSSASDTRWTAFNNVSCAGTYHLYCFED